MNNATTTASTISRGRAALEELNIPGRIPHAVENSAWIGLTTERDPSTGDLWAAVVVSGSPSATCHQCGQHAVFTGAPATLTQFGDEQPLDRQHGCGAWLESQWLLRLIDLADPHAADTVFDLAIDMATEVDALIAGDQQHDRDRIVGEIKAAHARTVAALADLDLDGDDVISDVERELRGSETEPGSYVETDFDGAAAALATWDYDPADSGETVSESTEFSDLPMFARLAIARFLQS